MPKKGWRSITIRATLAEVLEADGKKRNRSIPEQIEYLVENSAIVQVSDDQREIYRAELAKIAEELKIQNHGAAAQEI